MTEIGEFIFENNTTLFNALDKLDVPTLANEVKEISDALDVSKEQVRELSLVVDNNQVANNTKFVNINTTLNALEEKLENTNGEASEALALFESLNTYTRSNVMRIDSNVTNIDRRTLTVEGSLASLETDFVNLEGKVLRLSQDVEDVVEALESSNSRVTALTDIVNDLDIKLANLKAKFDIIDDQFSKVPITYEELYFSTGHILPGVAYRIVYQIPNDYIQATLVIDNVQPYRSIRMGDVYTGQINGLPQRLIQFSDAVTPTSGQSFQRQAGMVPVGGPITLRFRKDPSTPLFTRLVRVTKQFLR